MTKKTSYLIVAVISEDHDDDPYRYGRRIEDSVGISRGAGFSFKDGERDLDWTRTTKKAAHRLFGRIKRFRKATVRLHKITDNEDEGEHTLIEERKAA